MQLRLTGKHVCTRTRFGPTITRNKHNNCLYNYPRSTKEISMENLDSKVWVHFGLNWNLEVLVLWKGENRRTRRKTLGGGDGDQQYIPHMTSGNQTRATLVGGNCCHHCAIPALLNAFQCSPT